MASPWPDSLIARLGGLPAGGAPAVALIVFGSVARGQAGPDSDLDVLAVRPASVAFDDDEWTDALIDWSERARTVCGRPVEILEAGEDEVPALLAMPAPSVWHDIATEGVVLSGRPLADLAQV
jgi:predicted nucleotidyltransferase